MKAGTFRGAVDYAGGYFCCRDCIPKLDSGQRQTLVEDIEEKLRSEAAGDDSESMELMWGVVDDDDKEYWDDIGECQFCDRLPSKVEPGDLPNFRVKGEVVH